MKYEIRIISEEDTIKSKPYEDLDKAIEINCTTSDGAKSIANGTDNGTVRKMDCFS